MRLEDYFFTFLPVGASPPGILEYSLNSYIRNRQDDHISFDILSRGSYRGSLHIGSRYFTIYWILKSEVRVPILRDDFDYQKEIMEVVSRLEIEGTDLYYLDIQG